MKYLIIGNGIAGTTAAETIRKIDSAGEITIITDEDLPFYYRIRLNDYIAGDVTEQELVGKKKSWYGDRNISLHTGLRVVSGIPGDREIVTSNHLVFPYDRLLLATGSRSFIPPIAGADSQGVFTLRNFRDAQSIIQFAGNCHTIVLIGGGLLGLETGNALRKLGKTIQVVEFFPRLLPRQLDIEGARRLQELMEGMGFTFRLAATTREITGRDKTETVLLDNGEHLPADMVILSAGVRPNLDLASVFGLKTDKGIMVNEQLRTNDPNIFAAGDVAQFRDIPPYGIWPAGLQQGKVAGSVMAGGDMSYSGTVPANKLKVAGIDLASAGEIDVDNVYQSTIISTENSYQKYVVQDHHIIGCIMVGDTADFFKTTQAIADKTDLDALQGIAAFQHPEPQANN
ncbi:NAD(P)/FAD-dependent oxidoreductase [Thermodesulfobacteriota bacterium]